MSEPLRPDIIAAVERTRALAARPRKVDGPVVGAAVVAGEPNPPPKPVVHPPKPGSEEIRARAREHARRQREVGAAERMARRTDQGALALKIKAAVAAAFAVDQADMPVIDKRVKSYEMSDARAATALLIRVHCPNLSYPTIAALIGVRDHTSVIEMVHRAREKLAAGGTFRAAYKKAARAATEAIP